MWINLLIISIRQCIWQVQNVDSLWSVLYSSLLFLILEFWPLFMQKSFSSNIFLNLLESIAYVRFPYRFSIIIKLLICIIILLVSEHKPLPFGYLYSLCFAELNYFQANYKYRYCLEKWIQDNIVMIQDKIRRKCQLFHWGK